MSRIKLIHPEAEAELDSTLEEVTTRMGFLPTSQLVIRNVPGLTEAVGALAGLVFGPGAETSLQLRNLVALVASQTAGCRNYWAHSASNASRSGVEEERIAAVWEFETCSLFTSAERAALRFAGAAAVPSAVDDEVMDELRQHFDERQMTELMAVVATMGLLNRWNDALAAELESFPASVAERTLAGTPWTPGKHGGVTVGSRKNG